MANLASIYGCKNDAITKLCKECKYGRTWDGKRCIEYMRSNNMTELLDYVSVSLDY
jgi:hypothetical protein